MDVLVTYDIRTDDNDGQRRLARVAATCERYGHRAQYSVFECRITEQQLLTLIDELLTIIDRTADTIHIYKFSGSITDNRISLGSSPPSRIGKPLII